MLQRGVREVHQELSRHLQRNPVLRAVVANGGFRHLRGRNPRAVRRAGRNRPRARHVLAESLPADHLDIDYHDHHFLVSAGDGCLLRRGGLWRGQYAGLSSVRWAPAALSIGHDLYGDGSDLVRVHGRVDPVRRSQTERYHLQFLQVGNLPAGDDVRWDTEERRVRFRLRLPLKPSMVGTHTVQGKARSSTTTYDPVQPCPQDVIVTPCELGSTRHASSS